MKQSMTEYTMQKLSQEIYLKDPFEIAKKHLLGAYLCTYVNDELTVGKIIELEVYMGAEDKGAHTYNYRRTPRVESCYKQGGCAYVFFIYGMHYHFNVVIAEKDDPKAILIRAIEPVKGLEVMQKRRCMTDIRQLTNGPGKLCQALGITKSFDGMDLTGDMIWIAPRTDEIRAEDIVATPRIGIGYAEEYKHKEWRFVLKNAVGVKKSVRYEDDLK